MNIIKINNETLQEVLGSLAAFSIMNGNNPYIDELIKKVENEIKELNNE